MELTLNKDAHVRTIIKWTCVFIILTLCVMGINNLHQAYVQEIKAKANANAILINQKTFLIIQMHKEMLTISRTQLQILHASSEQEVRDHLWRLSELVSDHLVHYHQLKNITDESDSDLLMQFRSGFDQWHGFNKSLLAYANVVADSGFINILNKVDLAFSQLDSDTDERQVLITQLNQSVNNTKGLSN